MKATVLKRGLSALLTIAMISGMSTVNVMAADEETKSITKDGVTIETTDENFIATDLEIEVVTAEDGFHDFVANESNVYPTTTLMYGDNGFSSVIELKDNEGNTVQYSGDLTVTYSLPENWDLSHGVTVATVTTYSMGTMSYDTAVTVSNTIADGKVTFTLPYDNKTSSNKTRVLILQTAYAADLSQLEDGVYDVGLSMLSNVQSMSLSMASNTLDRDAKLIIKDGKKYLNVNFNPGIVMFMPAFANKLYAVDGSVGVVGKPSDSNSMPAKILSFYDEEYVNEVSFEILANGIWGQGYTKEELREMSNGTVLTNGIQYIHNAVLDITNSLQENGCYYIGFCSDIMDSLYDGVAGSDNGFNCTNVMISNPVKNTTANADELMGKEVELDFAELEPIYREFVNVSGAGNEPLRNLYTRESYEQYYVPAWQKVYQAYSYVGATQEDVDNAVTMAKEAMTKLEYVKVGETSVNAKSLLKVQFNRFAKLDATLYTSSSYNALKDTIPDAQEVYDLGDEAYNKDVIEQYYLVKNAYDALALKATDYTAFETAINEMKAVELDDYTEKTVAVFNEELVKAETMLATKDSSEAEIAAQIQALIDAKAELAKYDVLEDGVYKVNVEMRKINRAATSMANGAVNTTIKLEVVDGKYYATLDFKGMTITNYLGYLSKLWYYADGYAYNEFGEPTGELVAAEVLSTQKNADGTDVIDAYNDKNSLYPDLLKIQLVETSLIDKDGYVPLRVSVPIMEKIAGENADQNVLMQIDWTTLEKTTADDEAFKPDEPVEKTPAVDTADKQTGVKVKADKGVFPEGVELVVAEIKSGADYENAAKVLSDVGAKFKLFEIHFEDMNKAEIQPNGTVTVSYPIPEGYNADKLALYRINEDGTKTLIKGKVDGDYYVVVTKSFSTYAFVEVDSVLNDVQDTSDTQVNNAAKTADGANVALWAMLAVVGVLGMTACAKKRRVEGEN